MGLLDGVNVTWVYTTRRRIDKGGKFIDTGVMFLQKEDVEQWVAADPDNRRSRQIGVFNDWESYLKVNPSHQD